MAIKLSEIPKNTEIVKATCPSCGKTIHTVGFTKGSKCDGITVMCKFCGKCYEIKAD